MRTSAHVNVIVYCPKTEKGRSELACQMTEVHADFVLAALRQPEPPRQVESGTAASGSRRRRSKH